MVMVAMAVVVVHKHHVTTTTHRHITQKQADRMGANDGTTIHTFEYDPPVTSTDTDTSYLARLVANVVSFPRHI
jgi:hypothetical protein